MGTAGERPGAGHEEGVGLQTGWLRELTGSSVGLKEVVTSSGTEVGANDEIEKRSWDVVGG